MIQERYALAARASSLGMSDITQGPADVLTAAGWAGQSDKLGIGTLLSRLRAEADSVSVRELDGANEGVDRVLLLMRLQTLGPAKDALMRYGSISATRLKLGITDAQVARVIGAVIRHWLWPQCKHCDGRGTVDSTEKGPAVRVCKHCKGSGKASLSGGEGDEIKLGAHMLAMCDEFSASSLGRISRHLRHS